MEKPKRKAIGIAAVLIAAAVVIAVILYVLLGGVSCIRHLQAVRPTVETRYRFPDRNAKHLVHAKAQGIAPLDDESQVSGQGDALQRLRSCRHYIVKPATHSHPYLVPQAAQLVEDIGRRFSRKLSEKGYHPHIPVVTSMLRTKADVERLRKVNHVAVSNSAHQYGTTFDISYARYFPALGTGKTPSRNLLARTLGETLQELRREGRCCVKFEHSTNCYHITVRGL